MMNSIPVHTWWEVFDVCHNNIATLDVWQSSCQDFSDLGSPVKDDPFCPRFMELIKAAARGCIPACDRALLKFGLTIQDIYYNWLAMYLATKNKHFHVVAWLTQHGHIEPSTQRRQELEEYYCRSIQVHLNFNRNRHWGGVRKQISIKLNEAAVCGSEDVCEQLCRELKALTGIRTRRCHGSILYDALRLAVKSSGQSDSHLGVCKCLVAHGARVDLNEWDLFRKSACMGNMTLCVWFHSLALSMGKPHYASFLEACTGSEEMNGFSRTLSHTVNIKHVDVCAFLLGLGTKPTITQTLLLKFMDIDVSLVV